jgi:hypothetical protein
MMTVNSPSLNSSSRVERRDLFVDGVKAAERRGGDKNEEKRDASRLSGGQPRERSTPSAGSLDWDGGLAHVGRR